MDQPRMDRGQRAKSLRTRQRRRSDTREACVRREEGYFGERLEGSCSVLQVEAEAVAQLSRFWGIGTAENVAGAVAARDVEKPSLWRPVAVPAYPAYIP